MIFTGLLYELNFTMSIWILVLYNLQVLRYLTLSFQLSDLIWTVFQNNIAFLILELSQAAHQKITDTYPNFLSHFSSNVANSLNLIKTFDQNSTVSQHFQCQSVLQAIIAFLCQQVSLDGTGMFSFFKVFTSSTFIFSHYSTNQQKFISMSSKLNWFWYESHYFKFSYQNEIIQQLYNQNLDIKQELINKSQMQKKQKNQSLKIIYELKKQKSNFYPFYPVSAAYQENDNHYFLTVQYPRQVACLSSYLFKSDHSRKMGSNIDLLDINQGVPISCFQIIDIKAKQTSNSVIINQAILLIGYRSGHLINVHYKDKKVSMTHRYNKISKNKEGFFSKTASFFNSQQCYKTWMKGPIKQFHRSPQKEFKLCYLVGNCVIFYKNIDESCQDGLYKAYNEVDWENNNENTNKNLKNITYSKTQKVTKLIQSNSMMINFQNQVSSINYIKKEELIVSLSMKQCIKIYSTKNLQQLANINMSMPIRKTNYFNIDNQQFLLVMPYEDYLWIIDLTRQKYIKLIAHRCFVADSLLMKTRKNKIIVFSCGMDHRLCFQPLQLINNWSSIQIKDNNLQIDDDKQGIKFDQVFSLGEYKNARNNMHDYGFGDVVTMRNLFAISTYDSKIKVFQIPYI